MSEVNDMGCAEFGDVAAELALGVLTGRERARALAHLERCDACREDVRLLTVTGEELVGLLPAIEPPVGFETRVMDRLGLAAPAPARPLSPARRLGRRLAGWIRADWIRAGWTGARSGPRPRRILATAAVAAAVVVAGLGGWGLHGATSSPVASPLSSAPLLTASHQTAGHIYLYDADSRWLYMSVDLGGGAVGNGTVLCQVEDADGHVTTVGSFRLSGGYGHWGSPVPPTSGPLTSARLVTTTGTVLATAAFPA